MPSEIPWAHASVPTLSAAFPLAGAVRTDICVIGGGLTGLSAAAALAQEGASVILLEAGRVGDGATGASGGQLIPGFRHGAAGLIERFGTELATRLHGLTISARHRTLALAGRHSIDIKATGHLTAAARPRDMPPLEKEVAAMVRIGHHEAAMVDADAMSEHVGGGDYHGGLFDRLGGHLHPIKLLRAMQADATAAGVRIFEESTVTEVRTGEPSLVRTPGGKVEADQVVVACDAFADTIAINGRTPSFARRLMPVWSYQVATAPLDETLAHRLLPGDAAVSDTRFALDYYRLSADRRLLFSGGERYLLRPLENPGAFVRPHLLRVFPMLRDVPIDHHWSGRVAVTTSRFPQVGRIGNLWFAQGYSGHGLLLAQAAGQAIADAVAGRMSDFDLLAALPTRDWPGGRLLRHSLYTAGMLWFALKDRL